MVTSAVHGAEGQAGRRSALAPAVVLSAAMVIGPTTSARAAAALVVPVVMKVRCLTINTIARIVTLQLAF